MSFESGKTESKEKNPIKITVDVFRHGMANYAQEKVDLEEAKDLTPEGRDSVIQKACEIAGSIQENEEVTLWSSPYGRTLETAKVIEEVLREKGVAFRVREDGEEGGTNSVIKAFETFEEVRNFDTELFAVFVNGGSMFFAGREYHVDKNVSNPKDLSWAEYYSTRAWGEIDPQQSKIEGALLDKLDTIESEDEANQRLEQKLSTLSNVVSSKSGKDQRVIIVTHQGVMSGLRDEEVLQADYVEITFGNTS